MKRGPKSLLTKKLQAAICEILANGNTIETACAACGLAERTYFNWCQKNAAFYAATRKARAKAKIKLVAIIQNAAKTNANHAQWLLERSWPNEYARVERVEQIGEADDKKLNLSIYYDTGGIGMEKLTDFPNAETDSPAEAAAKQKRLLGETANVPDPQEKISDAAPPPKPLNPALTGRLNLMKSTFHNGRK